MSESEPFPARDIDLAEIPVEAETPRPIEFGRGGALVSFSAKGGAFAGFGVYSKAADVLKRVSPAESILPGLELPDAGDSRFLLLRWGYGAEASLRGSMALGAVGRATLNAAGSGDALFAVVRKLPASTAARAAVQDLVDSWLPVKAVQSIDQVEPGTWLVSEVTGSIRATLGAQIGYDFNWVRETEKSGLKGDIGLRIQAAASAQIGFEASGSCCVVVSRESKNPVLRLRVFRLTEKGLALGFSAGAVLQPVNTLLPPQADDFIRAVFGLHGAQVLADIRVVEQWTDPGTKLADLLASAGVEEAKGLIAHLAGVQNLEGAFEQVKERVGKFLGAWHRLPHNVAAALLKLAEERGELDQVRDTAALLSAIDESGLRALLQDRLRDADFFRTPEGRFLESMSEGGVLSLLSQPVAGVRSLAQSVLGLLDQGVVEESLMRFQQYLEQRLNVAGLMKAVSETDFQSLDGLLKKRAGDLLGRALDFGDLETVRTTIHTLLGKRQEFYERAVAATNRKYQMTLAGAFQKASTDSALLDVHFDFREDPAGCAEFLRQALNGNFDRILAEPRRGVTLGAATLSHGVKRQAWTDLSLPWFDRSHKHLNQSLASVTAKEQDGRVLVYSIASQDLTAGNERNSTLGLAMALAAAGAKGVRVHQSRLDLSYSLRQAFRGMKRSDLLNHLGPTLAELFPSQLRTDLLPAFAAYIDERTEEAIPNTPNTLGNALISIEVGLPEALAAEMGRVWLSLPREKEADEYKRMSFAIQKALKKTIPVMYFGRAERYQDLEPARVLLAYAAIPNFTDDGGNHWNWPDVDLRRGVLRSLEASNLLEAQLKRVRERLLNTPGLEATEEFYRPADAAAILTELAGRDERGNAVQALLTGLLRAEAEIIDTACEAGRRLAKGAAVASSSPSEAIREFAAFGAKLTEAFHNNVRNVYLGEALQPLGPIILVEATRAAAKSSDPIFTRYNAILNLSFLKPGAVFEPKAYVESGAISDEQVAVRERVVEFAVS